MSRSQKIREALKLIFRHRRMEEARAAVSENVARFRSGTGAIVPLLGPTRVGKTVLLDELKNELGQAPSDARVLTAGLDFAVGSVPPKPNDRDLYKAMLEAIGYNCREKENTTLVRQRLVNAIRDNGTRVIALDECSHCAERGANLSARAAADHFKTIVDATGITLLLVGLPKFQTLIDGNEQFRDRCFETQYLMPYDWRDDDDRADFFGIVLTALEAFSGQGVRIGLSDEDCLRRLYGVSGGRVGTLLRVLDAAAVLVADGPELRLEHLRSAAQTTTQAALGSGQYFTNEAPPDVLLTRSYIKVLNDAGVAFEPSGQRDLEALASFEAAQ